MEQWDGQCAISFTQTIEQILLWTGGWCMTCNIYLGFGRASFCSITWGHHPRFPVFPPCYRSYWLGWELPFCFTKSIRASFHWEYFQKWMNDPPYHFHWSGARCEDSYPGDGLKESSQPSLYVAFGMSHSVKNKSHCEVSEQSAKVYQSLTNKMTSGWLCAVHTDFRTTGRSLPNGHFVGIYQ